MRPDILTGDWIKIDNPRRIGALAVGIGLLIWLGWQIIGNTIADTMARSDPRISLAWRPNDSLALLTLAENQLSASKADASPQQIADLARHALIFNPLAEGAVRVLASVADREGQTERAGTLMALAAKRSLRDTSALLWLYNQRIQQNKPADALRYVDPILRTRPDLTIDFATALVVIAGVRDVQATLIQMLARDPPWRGWFLRQLAANASSPTITYTILSGLRSTAHPVRDSELKPYLDHLIAAKEYQLAFLSWLRFLPPAQTKMIPFVYDGDFETPVSGLPFDWVISSIRGATTDVVATDDKKHGRALRVVFANTRVPYRQVVKLLVLPPGSYQLSGMVKSDHLVNKRGMVWRIVCADDPKKMLGSTEPVLGTHGWHRFTTAFQVPATGCSAQWLRLELAAQFRIEEQVSGAVWYDDLAIRRTEAAPTSGVSQTAN